ncbi:IS66 family insertion sequence element accessory protein TnpA [Sphingobacterium litopenaei]|uniref:IS66 family insertion sequence element accessory protein TnpB n=1 Tax=Sphingobacterium litopenaei TaxID=2763500 RepID=A0ABR7YFW9_9SPHI|nr:IS66 family insertion sequence element accessory protein TnpB [Sphingobacterium litopenaei]MBD1430176.1 IS66 family insertion sequence element accessory protein TnpB [Sphingobacterium litopenaei]
MSSHEKRERMLSLVVDWKTSGLTQKAFCKLHCINVVTLGYWVSKVSEQESDSRGFIEMTSAPTLKSNEVEIIYPSGIRLKVSDDLSLISQLIRF